MDAVAESGRLPVKKHPIQPECGDEQAGAGWDGRTCLARPSLRRERGQGMLISPVQLTSSRIGNHARLIHTLKVMDHTYCMYSRWRGILR